MNFSRNSLLSLVLAINAVGGALASESSVTRLPAIIPYTVTTPGLSSAAIYDATGQVVRELQHAVPEEPGPHSLIWDGLDRTGRPVPAGAYTWRRLQMPGLRTTWLMSVGSSYPPGVGWQHLSGPGTHQSPGSVAVDASGIYVAAFGTENIETCMLKLSPDGKQRLWSALHPSAWDGAVSLAADGGEIFMLGHTRANADDRIKASEWRKQMVYVFDAASGGLAARTVGWTAVGNLPLLIDVQWDAQGTDIDGTDMDARDGVMCVAYEKRNALRWYDTKVGKLLGEVTLAAPQGVSMGPNGMTYVSSGDTVFSLSSFSLSSSSLTKSTKAPVVVAKGLGKPGRLSVDRRSSEILVYLQQTQQIVRLSATGTVLKTYGDKGGRQLGLYDAKAQRSFAGFSDVCADGAGGFYVTEAHAPPRRTAQIGADGAVIREWYGGQRWAPHATPEGDDASVLWVSSGNGALMRVLVDYTKKTWTVHSTYLYSSLADGLVGESHNEGSFFRVFKHAGATYVALAKLPTVLKLDEQTWQLKPVTVCNNINIATQAIKDFASTPSASFQWNDGNGDGVPQRDEVTFSPEATPSAWMPSVSADLSFFLGSDDGIRAYPVSSWNTTGAPVYAAFPHGERFGPLPARMLAGKAYNDARWALFMHRDGPSGRLYAGINPGSTGWCSSTDSFLQQWRADGTPTWSVGQQGRSPGEFGNLRGIAGIAHGCVVSIDVDGGWKMSNLARTYVHDQDGLFIGGLMDHPQLKNLVPENYQLGGELCHASVHTLPSGDVLFYGNWENEVRIYNVAGWKDWVRTTGTITLTTPAVAAFGRGLGQGLTMTTFADRAMKQVASVGVAPMVDARWDKQTPPAAVVWTGTVLPPYGPGFIGSWSETKDSRSTRDYGSSATFRFHGSSMVIVGGQGPSCGRASVLFDGVDAGTIDAYAEKPTTGVRLWEKSGLPPGDHEVVVTAHGWLAPRHAAASDGFITIEHFLVEDKPWSCAGVPYTFSTNADGAVRVLIDGVVSIPGETKNTARAVVTGTTVMLQRRPYPITINYLDGAKGGGVTLLWSRTEHPAEAIPTACLYPAVQ